ncbi:hypothetical protein CYMTET_34929 [Cymbomonas tetramitiformis]|uniref:L-arabinokinase n=1 Tax=Cymbomonas tetramitiformis TaxID=36881 RepID=A0AAE0FA60_9CHLO|nr:hypothetical protein CYMTET_34929 [Cymbomonas tetramitiformis]
MTSSKIRVAYYVTGHGLGHATRVAEVCRNLLILGHSVTVCTAAPEWVFRLDAEEKHQEHLKFRKVMLDYGAKQADALSVDMVGSLEEYLRTSVEPRESLIEAERAWLTQEVIEVVVSDVVPLACAAAEAAGIPSTCVSNFSWDFVYAEYLTAVGPGESKLRSIAWQYHAFLRALASRLSPGARRGTALRALAGTEVRREGGREGGVLIKCFTPGVQAGGREEEEVF